LRTVRRRRLAGIYALLLIEVPAHPFLSHGNACLFILASLIAQIRNRSRIAIAANLAALAVLCLKGNAAISRLLVRPLETRDIPSGPLPQADAIGVLGAVTGPALPPQPTVHLMDGADRLTYGTELYRTHKAPLVVLSGGGRPWDKGLPPESDQMTEIMQMLGVPSSAILEESASRNSHENAAYTSRVLLAHHLHGILLVTSAMTMPRALAAFRHQGIDGIAAPTDFTPGLGEDSKGALSELEEDALELLPSPGSLDESSAVLHEYIGLILCQLAGWI
jgi:uncharacterized SAM-binding protein YcdF (DUF218 family)